MTRIQVPDVRPCMAAPRHRILPLAWKIAALAALLAVACRARTDPPPPADTTIVGPASDAGIEHAEDLVRPAWTLSSMLKAPPVPVPPGVTNVTAHTPAGFDPSPPVSVVIFFHGSIHCAAHVATAGWVTCKPGMNPWWGEGHIARHDDADTNSIFIAPQLTFLGGGTAGRFGEGGYLRTFLDEVLAEIPRRADERPLSHDDVGDITLIGHSAGFMPIAAILDHGEDADRIRNVVLLDSLFTGDSERYARWLLGSTPERPRRLVAIYNAWGGQPDRARAIAERVRGRRTVALNPPGSIEDAVARSDLTLVPISIDHYYVPHMFLTKVIAGLRLPKRQRGVQTRDVDASKPVRPPLPVALDTTVEGVLADGDTRLKTEAVADDYTLDLDAGQSVRVRARGGKSETECPGHSCPLDVFLEILDHDAVVASDDDSGGGLGAEVSFAAPHAGPFTVRVTTSGTTYGSGYKSGPYALHVDSVDGGAGDAKRDLPPPR